MPMSHCLKIGKNKEFAHGTLYRESLMVLYETSDIINREQKVDVINTSQGQWENKVVPTVKNQHSTVSWLSLRLVSSLFPITKIAKYVVVRAML